MRAWVVIGDLRGHRDVALAGATPSTLVFEALGPEGRVRLACDRATGERVEAAAHEAMELGPSSSLEVQGVRIATRPSGDGWRELCRFHADGWAEQVLGLAPAARLVATDTHVLVIDLLDGRPHVRAIGALGPVVAFRLPPWVVTDAESVPAEATWSVIAATRARALVFVAGDRAAWLTFEQIAALYDGIQQLPERAKIELCARLPGTLGDGEVVVRKGSTKGDGLVKRRVRIEDRAGQRFAVSTFAAKPMPAGARYRLRDVDSPFPLLESVGDGPSIRVERMMPIETTGARAPMFPPMETRPYASPTPGRKARDFVTPQVRERISRLARLGLATTLDGPAVDEAITSAFGQSHMAPYHGAVSAAMILRAHWRSHAPAEDRARLDEDAIAFASRANANANATRRWALVMTHECEPLVVALEPAERAAIEHEGLLLFEPLPAYLPLPKDLASAFAELAMLIDAGPGDVVLADDGRVVLSLTAASALEHRLAYPKR